MLQSTINLIRQKTVTKEDFMAMSKEDRGDLYLDLMDTAEHLMDDDDVAYCEKLLIELENIERNPVTVKTQQNPEEDAKLIFMDLQKKARELEVTSSGGKYFGYDLADVQSALTSVEGIWKMLNDMHSIDQLFGCDPMYYGLANAGEVEAYLRREHYLPNIRNELSFEVTLFMDAKDALVSAMKGTLDLQSEVISQLTSGNVNYDCLCDDLDKELFNNNAQVGELLSGADLKEYVQVDLNSLEMDYDRIDPLDDYRTLPVCLSCKFNLERFKYDYAAELLDLQLMCLDHTHNDDIERD